MTTDGWLVINKPAGWHSVSTKRTDGAPDIQSWLAQAIPAQASLFESGLVNRIDKQTSGCMVAARTQEHIAVLRAGFGAKPDGVSIAKVYLALVNRGLDREGEFNLWFSSRYKSSEKVTVALDGSEQERGRCRWKLLRRSDGSGLPGTAGSFDLAEIELIGAGRRHQIRAGMAHVHAPLAGDTLYKGTACEFLGEGIALHAWRLRIDGVSVESPAPAWCGSMGRS